MAEWPLAYPGVPLARHLASVAKASRELFKEDLEVLSRRLRGRYPSSFDLGVLLAGAALLHDVGKASEHYREQAKASGRISFYMHETAWSLVLYSVARRVLDDRQDVGVFEYLDFTARVIARHHAAMECRHPVDLVRRCHERLSIVRRVVEKLDEGIVAGLLGELKCVASDLGVPRAVWSILLDESLLRQAKGEAVRCAERDITLLASMREDFVAVASLSGMLIVADVVVASFFEGRASDDRAAPAYALHWRGELAGRLSKLKSGVTVNVKCLEAY